MTRGRPEARILQLEDDATDADLIRRALEREGDFDVQRVSTREDFARSLQAGGFDLILSDYRLPGFDGGEALRLAREVAPEIPFVFVSGTIGEDAVVQTLQSGATDYILKENTRRLGPAVRRALAEARLARERRRDQETLRLQGAALEAAANAIMITDREGRVLWVNAAFTRMTGYEASDAVGRTPNLLKSGRHEPEFWRSLWADILVGRVWQGEIVNRRKDGSLYPEEMTITPLRGEDGEVRHFIAIKQDISERTEAAAALRRTEEQLRQAQKMEAVGRLAGGVAHDFNNLLTAILGFSGFLESSLAADDPRAADVREIRVSAERAAALTRQLLAFSRRQVLTPQVLDLNDVVESTRRLLARLIGEDVELRLLLDPALARVLVDAGQMEQVLMNLAINSRDAMPGGGALTIQTSNVEFHEDTQGSHDAIPAGRYVAVAVSDTGAGMDAATQTHLFEPFFTTKEQGKGTGLGLSTVYGIIKQSNGFVWVYSEPGKGSTFKIYLPACGDAAEASRREAPDPGSLAGAETILLVEDEDTVRAMLRRALRQHGYPVLECANGSEAVDLFERGGSGVDLVVTDVVMPGMGGRALADRLRAIRPGVRLLFMSGYTDDIVLREGELGPDAAFIQKPITPTALLRAIRGILDDAARPG